jgi:hypothetical protein
MSRRQNTQNKKMNEDIDSSNDNNDNHDSNENDNQQTFKQAKNNNVDASINAVNDYMKMILSVLLSIYTYVMTFIMPFALQFFKEGDIMKFQNMMISLRDYVIYVPILFEIYCLLFHTTMVRIWFMLNLSCTILKIYDDLCEDNPEKRLFKINQEQIKNLAKVSIGCGVAMLVLATSTVGFMTFPLMLYLINRTAKNILGKGF